MSWLHAIQHRLRVRLGPQRYAREQAEELRFHQMMEAIRGRAGRGSPTAERGAPGAFSFRHLDEEPRPMRSPLPDWLRQDVSYALRGIVRSPGFTAMVVVTLALGVGANAAVFSLLDRVFGQMPAGVRQPDQLRRLYINLEERVTPEGVGMIFPWFNWPAFAAVREGLPEVAVVAWTPSSESTLTIGDAELTVRRSFVTHDFFSVLGVGAARGRLFGPDEERVDVPTRVTVISHSLWKNALGLDPAVLGRQLEYGGNTYAVIGVAAEGFSGLDLSRTDVFFPVNTFTAAGSRPGLPFYEDDGNFFRGALRVGEQTDEATLGARATPAYRVSQGILRAGRTNPDSAASIVTGPIIEARGPAARDQMLSVSTRAAGVTAIVLLIACANIASLLLVRAARRRREIAVRLALGVSRRRLLSQMLTESVVLASLAGGTAVFIAVWGGGILRRLLLPAIQWAQPSLEGRTIAFTLVTAVGVGLAAGLVPALQTRRVDLNAGLKAGSRQGGVQRSWMRAGLLVAQAALSVVLLIGAGLFVRSLGNVNALDMGYDVEQLAAVRLPLGPLVPEQHEILSRAASRVGQLEGVSGVALATSAPMQGGSVQRLFLPGRDSLPRLPSGEGGAGFNTVSPEFFGVTGMQVVQGRGFRVGEVDGVVVVNETMARTFWPGESAIGKCMILGREDGPCSEVVGVAENARQREVIEEATLQYFVPLNPDTPSRIARAIVLRVDPAAWPAAVEVLRAELGPHLDLVTVRLTRLSDSLESQLRPWRLGAQLFTAFGLLALLVTLVGIYSVTSYAVSQRTHEMGVRIALGARMRDVISLVLREGVGVLGLGVVLGIGIAIALGKLVAALLYGVTPRDPAVMAAAAAILLAVGLIASFVPAWRAGRVDPVKALTAE